MIPMSLGKVAAAMGATGDARAEAIDRRSQLPILRVTTDSRDIQPGDLFFAIRGARLDGHRFLAEAASKGAVAGVVEDPSFEPPSGHAFPLLVVDNTVSALGRLATYFRREVLPPGTIVIAMTGSNGKTTTKCMIDHVLRPTLEGRASPKSFNNQIGVPLTLLSGGQDDRYLIVEIGSNAPGEVASLARMASPNAAVITSIGQAHLEGLHNLDEIAREKMSLLDHVRGGGMAVVNFDSPEIQTRLRPPPDVRLVTIGFNPRSERRVVLLESSMTGIVFVLDGRDRIALPLPGDHHAVNAAAAFLIARWLGLGAGEIIERLATFTPPPGRARILDAGEVKVIDDTYNANPTSMAEAVRTLSHATSQRRVFVMGDMLELGAQSPSFHRDAVHQVVSRGIEVLVAVGPACTEAARAIAAQANGRTRVITCKTADAAGALLDTVLQPGDTVWIKGSRALQLDRVVDHVMNRKSRVAGAQDPVGRRPA